MKKILILGIGLIISVASVFGQKTLKVTPKDMGMAVCRCKGDNEACVEIQSNITLTFESNMDKELTFCDMKHENGFYFYLLKFSKSNRKLTIKSIGYQYYIYDLDFNTKTFVGLYVEGGENVMSGTQSIVEAPPSKDFALNKSTRIGIQSKNVSSNWKFSQMLEEAFLDKGFNVLPAEVIISNQNNSVNGTISAHSAKYVPAAILISLTPSGSGGSLIIKIIDLRDQRVLFSGKYVSLTSRSVVNSFIKDITPFME